MQWSYLDLWRVTQHECFPTRFSYLKESSMESFILKPTSKINFSCSTTTTHLIGLQRKYHVFEHLLNSKPKSCSSQCPGASIYRLGAQMSVRKNIPGRRPDGWLIFPFLELGKKSETDRVLRGVQTCCWNVRTDASWIEPSRHSGGSRRRDTLSGRMMLGLSGVRTVWHVVRTDGTMTDGRPDGMARSSGRLTGNLNSSDLRTMNSGIPVYNIFTLKWFCPNTEWGQNTNMLCLFSRGFLSRFWQSLHISSHSIIFSLFSFVLLSCYAF
jgi:hypothetical protein